MRLGSLPVVFGRPTDRHTRTCRQLRRGKDADNAMHTRPRTQRHTHSACPRPPPPGRAVDPPSTATMRLMNTLSSRNEPSRPTPLAGRKMTTSPVAGGLRGAGAANAGAAQQEAGQHNSRQAA